MNITIVIQSIENDEYYFFFFAVNKNYLKLSKLKFFFSKNYRLSFLSLAIIFTSNLLLM